MQLEKQVCSLKLAKRLKELGVKQNGRYIWWLPTLGGDDECETRLSRGCGTIRRKCSDWISAFTVAELGEMLPDKCPQHGGSLNIRRGFGKWLVGYGEHQEFDGCHVEGEDNEADARAKCLVYLLENNPLIHPQLT